MDPDAPLNVARGTAITSFSSAALSSLYGTLKKQPIGPLASSAALNSGIVAATFFSLREYVVSPILLTTVGSGQFARRNVYIRDRRAGTSQRPEPVTWNEMRMEKLPDTAISGALAGSLFNGWKRGRAGLLSGAITASLACSVLQLGFNEMRILRVRYVHQQDPDGVRSASAPATSNGVVQPVPKPVEPSRPVWERLLLIFGIHKMSTEEYLSKLKKQREDALRRIAVLEAEEAASTEQSSRPEEAKS